ncbi:hypothetical protein Baya_16747 [Bagarius yarrelli]|uniref:Uncharacterized protein n=1 Tax=Bagarius yarrelli TaxID=175774 RepID=A0A556VWI8_BAGYA|nr:hypothetical protein Baya_16747 [Bagarius yarrelli]
MRVSDRMQWMSDSVDMRVSDGMRVSIDGVSRCVGYDMRVSDTICECRTGYASVGHDMRVSDTICECECRIRYASVGCDMRVLNTIINFLPRAGQFYTALPTTPTPLLFPPILSCCLDVFIMSCTALKDTDISFPTDGPQRPGKCDINGRGLVVRSPNFGGHTVYSTGRQNHDTCGTFSHGSLL